MLSPCACFGVLARTEAHETHNVPARTPGRAPASHFLKNDTTILNVTQGDYAKVANGKNRYEETVGDWDSVLSKIKELVEKWGILTMGIMKGRTALQIQSFAPHHLQEFFLSLVGDIHLALIIHHNIPAL